MDSNPLIKLPSDLARRCERHAEEVVNSLHCWPQCLAYSSHGADTNIKVWADAKMAECAFALYVGLDPLSAVSWENRPDDGKDIYFAGLRWDVKNTSSRGRRLIWPVRKNPIFDSKDFDCLVLVKTAPPICQICGFTTKAEFYCTYEIAGDRHKLTKDTWYLDQSELWPPANILQLRERCRA